MPPPLTRFPPPAVVVGIPRVAPSHRGDAGATLLTGTAVAAADTACVAAEPAVVRAAGTPLPTRCSPPLAGVALRLAAGGSAPTGIATPLASLP